MFCIAWGCYFFVSLMYKFQFFILLAHCFYFFLIKNYNIWYGKSTALYSFGRYTNRRLDRNMYMSILLGNMIIIVLWWRFVMIMDNIILRIAYYLQSVQVSSVQLSNAFCFASNIPKMQPRMIHCWFGCFKFSICIVSSNMYPWFTSTDRRVYIKNVLLCFYKHYNI